MNKCEELYDYILKSEDILGEIDKVAKSERVTDDMYIYYIYNVITRHISINDFNGISYNLYKNIIMCVSYRFVVRILEQHENRHWTQTQNFLIFNGKQGGTISLWKAKLTFWCKSPVYIGCKAAPYLMETKEGIYVF